MNPPFARKTLYILVFDFMDFNSSGVSLLIGQSFLPVSLAMLSMVTLESVCLQSWCILKEHGAYILKKEKEITLPSFLYNFQAANVQCISNPKKSFLYNVYDFYSTPNLFSY